jgi:Protein of unknown function (DUF3616)
MHDASLLTRIVLDFGLSEGDKKNPSADLSAVCLAPDGALWLAADEGTSLERLELVDPGKFAKHRRFDLSECFKGLDDEGAEIDIEGLDVAEGFLWIVGSHGSKRKRAKGKGREADIERLATVVSDGSRSFLARVPLDWDPSRAERLGSTQKSNVILDALNDDVHLGPFLRASIPGKDNGFDVEGLCVQGDLVYLGLRGPVLRGYACILTIKPKPGKKGNLELSTLDSQGTLVHKTFLDLDGLGVRDMRLHDGGMLILAGPTMVLDGAIRLFRLEDVGDLRKGIVHGEDSKDGHRLKRLFEIPHGIGCDRAEGIALFPWRGFEDSLLIVFDSPAPERILGKGDVLADLWRLPSAKGAQKTN